MRSDTISSYKDLIVWQKSMLLVEKIYEVTELYPSGEKFGLVSQTRRCAVSIPSNIAEGKARGTRKDYRHFVINAFASGAELETQVELATRLKFVNEEQISELYPLLEETMKMLNVLVHKLSQ